MGSVVYGPGYIKTSQGILKLLEALMCLIGLCLIASYDWRTDIMNANIAGTSIGLIVSIIMFLLHVSKVGMPIQGVLAYQLFFNLLWFIYLLIVSSILLSKNYTDKCQAGGSFGLIAAFLFLIDCFDCYRNDPTPLHL